MQQGAKTLVCIGGAVCWTMGAGTMAWRTGDTPVVTPGEAARRTGVTLGDSVRLWTPAGLGAGAGGATSRGGEGEGVERRGLRRRAGSVASGGITSENVISEGCATCAGSFSGACDSQPPCGGDGDRAWYAGAWRSGGSGESGGVDEPLTGVAVLSLTVVANGGIESPSESLLSALQHVDMGGDGPRAVLGLRAVSGIGGFNPPCVCGRPPGSGSAARPRSGWRADMGGGGGLRPVWGLRAVSGIGQTRAAGSGRGLSEGGTIWSSGHANAFFRARLGWLRPRCSPGSCSIGGGASESLAVTGGTAGDMPRGLAATGALPLVFLS